MKKILTLISLFAVILTGCTKTDTSLQNDKKSGEATTIQIGLIPERNIFDQMERYEHIANYLSKKTGTKIILKALTRYGNILENFVSLQLDGAFMGSFTYVLAHTKLGVEPIARPEDINGVSTYYGMIFVRKDSGIRTAKDMQGKIFACVDRATTAGHLLPLAFFKENNIHNFNAYVKETYFAGTHDNAIHDVLNGRADIGAAKNTVFEYLAKDDERIGNDLHIITRSPRVPQNALVVRKDLDISIRNNLQEALLNMHKDPEGIKVLTRFGAKQFIPTTNEDYSAVYKYINTIGLDLSVYDYIND